MLSNNTWGFDYPPNRDPHNHGEEFGEKVFQLPSRQVSAAHEVEIALAGGTTPFVESPDDEALSSAAVASSEDTGDASGVFAVVGFYVAAWVAFNAKGIEQWLLRSEEAHGE